MFKFKLITSIYLLCMELQELIQFMKEYQRTYLLYAFVVAVILSYLYNCMLSSDIYDELCRNVVLRGFCISSVRTCKLKTKKYTNCKEFYFISKDLIK